MRRREPDVTPALSRKRERGKGNAEPETDGLDHLDVSRETRERLQRYLDLLGEWNARINLVAPASLGQAWRRHIVDSAQLLPLIPPQTRCLVDLGSGAGFPGLVLAVLGVPEIHLIEADQRKCAFLREVARMTDTAVTIHNRRIEAATGLAADCITARALAPLPRLLDLASPFLTGHTICLFLKGARAADELTEARKAWHMEATFVPSLTDPAGAILRLEKLARVDARSRG